MIYKNVENLIEKIKPSIVISNNDIRILDRENVRENLIDDLIENIRLNENIEVKNFSAKIISEIAKKSGIYLSSIHEFYMSRGRNEYKDLTVPAINLRGFTYEAAKALMRVVVKNNIGAFILELARSEMGYTEQSPIEYASVILGAAIKEGFQGPLFIQLDHGQVNLKKYNENPEEEIKNLKDIMEKSIKAGFYNIDIDSSTLVDLKQPTILEQQRKNFEIAAELTQFIRELEPEGITISIGGEIGEIGKKNSNSKELRTFIEGYNGTLKKLGNYQGLSKISVQSGATHGGVVLPDGSIAKVKIDFEVLKNLGKIAREEYKLGGVVQHGASTLPEELFHKFPEAQTLEIHLATGFQNIILDHPDFPQNLKEKMYSYIKEKYSDSRKEDWTTEQFLYKLRKKAWGPFKKEVYEIPKDIKEKISYALEKKFDFFFDKLNIKNTKKLIAKYIKINN